MINILFFNGNEKTSLITVLKKKKKKEIAKCVGLERERKVLLVKDKLQYTLIALALVCLGGVLSVVEHDSSVAGESLEQLRDKCSSNTL